MSGKAKSSPVQKVPLRRLSQIINKTDQADGQQPEEDQQDQDGTDISVTSRGSDRRLSMKKQGPKSCSEAFTLDDWLAVLLVVALVGTAVFSGLCAGLHGDKKRQLTENRPFNMALLVSGCVVMTLQLLCACVYASQWLTGV